MTTLDDVLIRSPRMPRCAQCWLGRTGPLSAPPALCTVSAKLFLINSKERRGS